jgi:hypothetical protein
MKVVLCGATGHRSGSQHFNFAINVKAKQDDLSNVDTSLCSTGIPIKISLYLLDRDSTSETTPESPAFPFACNIAMLYSIRTADAGSSPAARRAGM